jgi:diaminopropionate ammonia-lyase
MFMNTPRLTHNSHADRASVSKAGIPDPAFHPSLPDFATTPMRPAPKAAQRLGVRSVLVKDESQRMGMPSFKILGASWATYCTIMAHLDQAVGAEPTLDKLRQTVAARGPDLTLVAASDGNHGRAVARMAKLLGLGAIIIVPAGTVDSRMDAISSEGAEVRIVDGGYDQAIAASAALSDDKHVVISDTSWAGYTDTPGWVIDGYSTMLTEVIDEIEAGHLAEPTVVAAQMGVGAFAASVTRQLASRPARLLVGVEPTKADCIISSAEAGKITTIPGRQDSIMAGLNCGTPSIVAWDDVLHGYDIFVTVTDDHARDAVRLLHDDGIEAGESGAAGLAGLLAHAEGLGLGLQDDVIVFLTEGVTDPAAYRAIIGSDS